MLDRQRIVTTGITATALATVALVAWLRPWSTDTLASKPEPMSQTSADAVDIVFAVDTTGSMGGLLDGAKQTVWSIANQVRSINPNASLRVGLVAYRDLGENEEYVTKDFALTEDLDAMYAELSSYQAAGGGDEPENVDAALYNAVHKMQWRSGAKKMIFLVGDAPPSSRGEVPKYTVTALAAAKQQIKINAIRCGESEGTAKAWQQIASLGHGEFSTIRQDGGVQQIATPFDDRIGVLSAEIDSTAVIYGDAPARERYQAKIAVADAAPAAAKADRGAYYAGKGAVAAAPGEDAVAAVTTGTMSVDSLDEGKLPADLRDKSKAELKSELEARAKRRADAQKEIAELAKQRDEYIKSNTKDAEGGFDAVVKKTLEAQLK